MELSESTVPAVANSPRVKPFVADRSLSLPSLSLEGLRNATVLAPHPDDEALGCGGIIAALSAQGAPPQLIFGTNGEASHPRSQAYPPAVLAQLRRHEAVTAAGILGVPATNVHFLDLPDGAVPAGATAAAAALAATLGRLLQTLTLTAVFVPWREDPHCDHRALTAAVIRAKAELRMELRILEYPVWIEEDVPANFDANYRFFSFPITAHGVQKRQAILAHRSQTSPLIADDPEGFHLSESMIAAFTQPDEVFFEFLP